MALAEATHKIVEEFEFTADDVNKAVHEFLREMGKGGRSLRLHCSSDS